MDLLRSVSSSPYWKLTKFIAPLALTSTVQDIGEQALNRSLVSSSTKEGLMALASFSIAYKILHFIIGGIEDSKYLNLVLVRNQKDRRKLILFNFIVACCASGFLLLTALTKVGEYLIEDLYRVDKNTGDLTRKAMLVLSGYPIIECIIWPHIGLLTKTKNSVAIGFSCIMDVVCKVVVVIIFLSANIQISPLYIPLIAAYISQAVRVVICLTAYYKYVNDIVTEGFPDVDSNGAELKMMTILKTWLPLFIVRLVQRITRPVIMIFVSRNRPSGEDEFYSIKQLAILSICFTVPRVPYSWLNELKALEPTFTKKNGDGQREISVRKVRIFGLCCGALSAFPSLLLSHAIQSQLVLFWIPDLTVPLIIEVSNVSESIARLTIIPLKICFILTFTSTFRDMTSGWVYKNKKNNLLYPGIVLRTISLVAALYVLPKSGLYGATMGISVLVITIVVESCSLCSISFFVSRRMKKEKIKNRALIKGNEKNDDEEKIELTEKM